MNDRLASITADATTPDAVETPPPNGRRDSPGGISSSESVAEHYVFTDLVYLKLCLQMAKYEKKNHVFYDVPKMGNLEVELKINLDIEGL